MDSSKKIKWKKKKELIAGKKKNINNEPIRAPSVQFSITEEYFGLMQLWGTQIVFALGPTNDEGH